MTTDTALIEKREELKRRLAAGEYKTLVDFFLEWFDRLIRKITRRQKSLPIWLIMVILSLAIPLINFGASYVAGDWASVRNVAELYGLGYGLGVLVVEILPICIGITFAVAINQYIGRIFILWHDEVLDVTESIASLKEFEDWLVKTCNWRLHLLVTIIGGLFSGLYTVALTSTSLGRFVGYGFAFSTIVVNITAVTPLYPFLMVVLLSARLRRYDLKLFKADPSSSEIISRLSSVLGFVLYFVAMLAAYATLITALGGFLPSAGIILILLVWLPIIAMFILNQTSLSSIIRRVKWKTLNEVQAKVEKLQTAKNFGNQETMDAIKRLMDYHDRVKSTRDSALDFRTYLSFINSLLLPLLAFILGNLDLVLNLFLRKP